MLRSFHGQAGMKARTPNASNATVSTITNPYASTLVDVRVESITDRVGTSMRTEWSLLRRGDCSCAMVDTYP